MVDIWENAEIVKDDKGHGSMLPDPKVHIEVLIEMRAKARKISEK